MTIPKMRTINEALAQIKAQDSNSAVTSNCIRTLCKGGKVKHIMIGKKIILDFDDLCEKLSLMAS